MSLSDNQIITPQTDSKEQNELTVPFALYEPQHLIAQPVFDQNNTSPVDDTLEKRYYKLTLLFFILGFCTLILWLISFLYCLKSKRKETRILGGISLGFFLSFIYVGVIIVSVLGANMSNWLSK